MIWTVIAFVLAILMSTHGAAQGHQHHGQQRQEIAKELGDFQFKHEEYHDLYQKLYPKFFGKDKCHCSSGQCRPSAWRSTGTSAAGEPIVEVRVNGTWCKPPSTVFLKRYQLDREDWAAIVRHGYTAHVCAYSSTIGTCPTIECVLILSDS